MGRLGIISLCCCIFIAGCSHSVAIKSPDGGIAAIGQGSLPGRLLADGTVCIVEAKESAACKERLFKIPEEIMGESYLTFDGIFDLDNDGSPEVFVEYWPYPGDHTQLLIYKKMEGAYTPYLKLTAETAGYAPAAWFLDESPERKAVFMTRYGGSSGLGLFYLDLKKKSLDLITGDISLDELPLFEDIDRDGIAEIFLHGRGRDRTSAQGAGILHWKDGPYKLLWPDWDSSPYVIYAVLADLDGDGKKEIIAVLDPEKESSKRGIGVWKYKEGLLTLISKTGLPDASHLGEPEILKVLPMTRGVEIGLGYFDKEVYKCLLLNGQIVCPEKTP
jgi:hypothetical protein